MRDLVICFGAIAGIVSFIVVICLDYRLRELERQFTSLRHPDYNFYKGQQWTPDEQKKFVQKEPPKPPKPPKPSNPSSGWMQS